MIFPSVFKALRAIRLSPYKSDIQIVLLAVIYFVAAYGAVELAFSSYRFIPVWPPAGIGLALLLLFGRRTWPGLAMGALLAFGLIFLINDVTYNFMAIMALAALALFTTLSVFVGYVLWKYWIGDCLNAFSSVKYTFRFITIGVIVSLLESLSGSFLIYQLQLMSGLDWSVRFLSWFVGDLVSIWLFLPLIISWSRKIRFSFNSRRSIEFVVAVVISSLIIYLTTIEPYQESITAALPYLVFPIILWSSYRLSLNLAMIMVVLVCTLAVYFTTSGLGPLQLNEPIQTLILLQLYISILCLIAIILSASENERKRAQEKVRQFNERLEMTVQERTQELKEEIKTRKAAEEEITSSNVELRKINTELDNFVYRVSHDLRAPIASVLGLVNLAQAEKDKKMIPHYFTRIKNMVEHQDNFIKEILDYSRNSRLELEARPVDFKKMIKETFDIMNYAYPEKKISKKIKVQQTTPFLSDEFRLNIVMNNLLSNAIRYTNGKDPEILIDVKTNKEKASITIRDNGEGIPFEHQDKIFDMFYRASEKSSGSGLGLYIVKETISKLGGEISFESAHHEGTTFYVEIPAAIEEKTRQKDHAG